MNQHLDWAVSLGENVDQKQGSPCSHLVKLPIFARDFDRALQSLTYREQEVLLKIIEFPSNREIARALSITERTVKAHLTSVMAKLGLQTRTEAAIVALRYHERLCSCTRVHQSPIAVSA